MERRAGDFHFPGFRLLDFDEHLPVVDVWIAYNAIRQSDTGSTQEVHVIDAANPGTPKNLGKGNVWGWISPRIIVWVFAQLHLLFAAFVLAVPMFALLIEVVGHLSKDPEQKEKYDSLAHEFTRLLATAFSITGRQASTATAMRVTVPLFSN